ncbi:hypothetical protein CW304_21895 [Bacillus sp. UFRGS-B20]|nr:hypothetical protein CW304_21895 [Bacillus sp. UFRGS-B20]
MDDGGAKKSFIDCYKKGPEAVISLFEETFSKLVKTIQELEPGFKKKTSTIVITTFYDGLRKPITKSFAQTVYMSTGSLGT